MSRIFAVRANAFDFSSGLITTVSGKWDSDVWDAQKWDTLAGTIYAGGSGDVLIKQAAASGSWDITDIVHCISGVAKRVAVPLQGRYVQLQWSGLSGAAALKAFRGQLWGKLADIESRVQGYNRTSADFRYIEVNASGEVAATVGSTTISGNIVIAKVSGETVVVTSTIAKVSGETVIVTSTVAKVSGETVVVPSTSVSGNIVTVPLTSVSGNILTVPLTSVSGNILTVPLTSVSGNAVSVSGNIVTVPLTSVSGNAVSVSGNLITASTSVSGNIVVAKISGDTVVVTSTSISGNAVSVSGNILVAKISGDTVVVTSTSISGNAVSASGNIIVAKISGDTVVVTSTSVSGNVVGIGQQSTVKPVGVIPITANSGGVALANTSANYVLLRAIRANASDIYVAASASGYQAYSGFGLTLLEPGDSVSLGIANANLLSVCAANSGDAVIYGATN